MRAPGPGARAGVRPGRDDPLDAPLRPERPRSPAAGGADPASAEREVLAYLPPRLRPALAALLPAGPADARWLEVRLRAGGPVGLVTDSGDLWVGAGGPRRLPEDAEVCTPEDVDRAVQAVTQASVYAWEEELAQAFCTLPGGHRAGLAGRARRRAGRLCGQKAFTSVNVRLARAVPGAADGVARALAGCDPAVPASVLLFGPPGSGKTTVLRDLLRQWSAGRPDLGLPPRRVGLVDERSEVAACADGRPQFDLGPRTDVLDGWPKAEGMLALIRAMGPQVVACDELGGPGDAAATAEAGRCGVAVVATAHAASVADLLRRPSLRAVLRTGVFGLAVRLGSDRRVAEVAQLAPAARRALARPPGRPPEGSAGGAAGRAPAPERGGGPWAWG